MDNEVVREDSDSTQRRTWTAAEAAAHPALGMGSTDSLSRMPRGSQAPTPASSETVVTPAPQFDGSGERLDASELVVSSEAEERLDGDDLDGIVELSSTMLVEDSESSEIEMLSDDLVEEDVVEEDVIDDDAIEGIALLGAEDVIEEDVIEEVDSDLLSFVEARGEIDEKPQRAPAPIEVSSVSLSALHETLHNQAVDSGMATYSTGVPIHSLDRDSNTGKTLQIVRPEAAESLFTIRNILMGTVFLAGIGAGIFFGLPTSSSSATSSSATAQPAASATAAMVVPADASESTQAAASSAVGLPVVAPLVENTEDPEAGSEPALAPTEVAATEAAEPLAVAPLETLAVAPSEEPSEDVAPPSNIDVRPLDVEPVVAAAPETETAPETEVIAPVTRKASRRARSNDADGIAPRTFGSGDPGVLMLGAKPPCDIFIDGKKTGLKTPQRVLRLPPGKHKITLINQEHKLRDSFRVSIQSGKKTRIVRDMTSKIQ